MIHLINTFDAAHTYLREAQQPNVNLDALWNNTLIEPYWNTISQYAPFDCSFMKPKPIRDLPALQRQLAILDKLDMAVLAEQFTRITEMLPKDDDDPIYVALYPLGNENSLVKERQNGVVGACVFGNIVLNINPLADDFASWIPYVFAHEYYHSVWGHHWFVKKQGAGLKNNLLEMIINEGEADYFATTLHPGINPQWLSSDEQVIKESWNALKNALDEQDQSRFDKYMFGSEEENIPWAAGYKVGYHCVSLYMTKLGSADFNALLNTVPDNIFSNAFIGLKRGDVRLADYRPEWHAIAQKTIRRLWCVFGTMTKDIQHVGSTAVASMKAKPIINITVAVEDISEVAALTPELNAAGFYQSKLHAIADDILFCDDDEDADTRSFHVHVVKINSAQWDNYLNFRDYLNTYPAVANEYSEVKVSLAERFPDDRNAYTDGKDATVSRILRDAHAWRNNNG